MRNRRMVWCAAGLIGVLLPVAGLAMLNLSAQRPANLGVTNGRLAPCPDSPNCVSSQAASESQRVEPLPLTAIRGSGEQEKDVSRRAIERLAAIIAEMPRAQIVRQTDDYLNAEFTTRLFRFVDDVEFYVDVQAGEIHCRSASRAGYSDMGVNRKRIEAIRAALAKSAE